MGGVFKYGRKNIGMEAERIVDGDVKCRGVLLYAAGTNSASIFFGGSNVDTDTKGFELEPGKTMTIPLRETQGLYAISTSTQSLSYMVMA